MLKIEKKDGKLVGDHQINKGKGIKMSVLEKLTLVLKELELALRDAEKFDGGTSAAGARLRKQAQSAILSLKDIRKTVQDVKVSRKTETEKPA